MLSRTCANTVRCFLVAVGLLMAPLSTLAAAQERPASAIEIAGGSVGFADDGVVWERFVGGNARFYASPRLSLGPEIAYIQGRNEHLAHPEHRSGRVHDPALAPGSVNFRHPRCSTMTKSCQRRAARRD